MSSKSQNLNSLIVSAIVLRLVFSSLFFHPDIKKINYQVQFFKQGIVDIYQYIKANSRKLPNTDTFNYPPLAYFTLGSWQAISSFLLGPDLDAWLNNWGSGGYTHPRMFEFMLVLKFPFLVLDLIIGLLLLRFAQRLKTNDYRPLAIWFFNPLSLYAIYMLSSFDLLPAALTVLALFFVKDKKLLIATFLLGLGAGIKTYPLLLLPFVIIRGDNFRQATYAVLAFLAVFMIPLFPVILSPEFITTMTHSNLMQGIFYAAVPMSATQNIPLFVIVWGLVFWFSWHRRANFNLLPEFLTLALTVTLLSHFHGQWILWSLPFAILALSQNIKLWPVAALATFGYFGTVWLIPDQFLTFGLFSAINPHSLLTPSLYELFKPLANPEFAQSIFHTLLAASGIWFIFSIWKSHEKS